MIDLNKLFKIITPTKEKLRDFMYQNYLAGTYVVDGYQMKLIKARVNKQSKHLSHDGITDTEYEEVADKIILLHPADFTKNGAYLYNFYYGAYKKMNSDDVKHVIDLLVKSFAYSRSVYAVLMQDSLLLALSNKSSQDIAYHTHSNLDTIENIRAGGSLPTIDESSIRDLTIKNCLLINKYLNYDQLLKKAKKQLYSPHYEHEKKIAYQKNDYNKLDDLEGYEYIFQGLNDKKTLDKLNNMEEKHVIKGGQLVKV